MNLKSIRILSLLIFCFPYFFIFYSLDFSAMTWTSEMGWALKNSLTQSVIAAIISAFLGIIFSIGLITIQKKFRAILEIYFLTTSFVPSLFLVLALMKLVDPFPMGLLGIILVHVSTFFGFATVLIARAIESKVGNLAETAFVLGSSKIFFIRKVLVPRIKFELLFVALVIFQMCMTSFSTPLLVGGQQGTNLEVLMYEKIRINADWGGAAQIGLVQIAIIIFLSVIIMGFKQRKFESINRIQFLGSSWSLYLAVATQALLLIGYLLNLQNFDLSKDFLIENTNYILELSIASILISVLTFFMLKFSFYFIAKSFYSTSFRFFLKNFSQPSVVLSAFSFLLLGSNQGYFIYFKIIIVFVILNTLGLFKLGVQTLMDDLEAQRQVARTLGANENLIFKVVIYPQIIEKINQFALLGSIVIIGDFSIGRILALKDLTLSMFMQTLMSGYRLELATWLSLILILITLISYYFSKELGNVCYKKFKV